MKIYNKYLNNLIVLIILAFMNVNATVFSQENSASLNANISKTNEAMDQSISIIEFQIYGKKYNNDSLNRRFERLEKTFFGNKIEGDLRARLDKINGIINKSNQDKANGKQLVILDLLENRNLGTSFKSDSLDSRITRLEQAILGKNQEGTAEERFDNLIALVPMSIIGVSVTDGSGNKVSTSISSKAAEPSQYHSPVVKSAPINDVLDYFSNIKKYSDNKVSRWHDLPILVYIYPSNNPQNLQAVKNVVSQWNKYLQISVTNSIKDSQIVINWDNAMSNNTRSKLSISDGDILYQVIVSSGYYKDKPYFEKFISHQLGHALGIWGHSNNKNDLMYNFSEFSDDINLQSQSGNAESVINAPNIPSLSDIKTLNRIYSSPCIGDY